MTESPVVRMTSPMLKAMAHPLRRQIMSLMSDAEPMRAVDLSERLGEPANSISFHLRKLAEAGMLREAPELARDKRDRVWVSAGEAFSIPDPDQPMSAEDEWALRGYVDQVHLDLQDLIGRVLAWSAEWSSGRDPVQRAELSLGRLELTREDMAQMVQEMSEVVKRAKKRSKETADQPGRISWETVTIVAESDLGL